MSVSLTEEWRITHLTTRYTIHTYITTLYSFDTVLMDHLILYITHVREGQIFLYATYSSMLIAGAFATLFGGKTWATPQNSVAPRHHI